MKRWNYKTKSYVKYEVPLKWNCPVFCADMDEKINCAECGKEVTFGETYSSFRIFNDSGVFSHMVCPECHEREYKEGKSNRGKQNV